MIDLLSYSTGAIMYGVTKANVGKFTPLGFSVSQTQGIAQSEVQMCRNALSLELGFSSQRTHWQQQVHGINIKRIPQGQTVGESSDGMVCNEANRLLCVSIADCCAVLIWNNEQTCIAALHSGWRGTHQNIVAQGIGILHSEYHIAPDTLCAWLSPCASADTYTVRSDVQQYFVPYCTQIGDDQYLFDNKKAIYEQLLSCGVPKQNIKVSAVCTIADSDYHSFRRDGIHSGRMAAFIGIR